MRHLALVDWYWGAKGPSNNKKRRKFPGGCPGTLRGVCLCVFLFPQEDGPTKTHTQLFDPRPVPRLKQGGLYYYLDFASGTAEEHQGAVFKDGVSGAHRGESSA